HRAGPFHVDDGDTADGAATDGLDHLRRAERVHVAAALQALLVLVHRIGDIDGQNEREVDLTGRVGGAGARGEGRKAHESESENCGDDEFQALRSTRHRTTPISVGPSVAPKVRGAKGTERPFTCLRPAAIRRYGKLRQKPHRARDPTYRATR